MDLKINLKEIGEELKSVLSGQTLDAILPPLVFIIGEPLAGLGIAVILALGLALVLEVVRLLRKQSWIYAAGGILGVGLAAGLAWVTRSAANYFIPAILSSSLLLIVTVVSILFGKPLAAWVSHLSRGWPLEWFWRADIKPAYSEVPLIWAFFFVGVLRCR